MRAIINISSNYLAESTGWRVRAITVEGKDAPLKSILQNSPLEKADGSLHELLTAGDTFKDDVSIFIKGELYFGSKVDIHTAIRDNEQLHIGDWPFEVRDA